jgi:hypothetical protein
MKSVNGRLATQGFVHDFVTLTLGPSPKERGEKGEGDQYRVLAQPGTGLEGCPCFHGCRPLEVGGVLDALQRGEWTMSKDSRQTLPPFAENNLTSVQQPAIQTTSTAFTLPTLPSDSPSTPGNRTDAPKRVKQEGVERGGEERHCPHSGFAASSFLRIWVFCHSSFATACMYSPCCFICSRPTFKCHNPVGVLGAFMP